MKANYNKRNSIDATQLFVFEERKQLLDLNSKIKYSNKVK